MSDELPEGWCLARGDKLFGFVTSGSRGWARYYSENGARFLRVGNLDRDSIRLDLREVQRVKPPHGVEGVRTRVVAGDLLISITADVGMVAVAPDDLGDAFVNQHLALARPVGGYLPEYVAWYLASEEGGQQQFRDLDRGAIKSGLSLEDIRAVEIPLAPLAEQHRIVAKVEAILAEVNAARDRVAKIPAILKRLRQSVLAAACSGRLTEDWRSAHQPTSSLVDALRKTVDNWLEPAFDHREQGDLPPSWDFVALGNLGTWSSGGTPSKARPEFWRGGTIPWVSAKDMKISFIDSSEDRITLRAVTESAAKMVPEGTLLFVVRGMILAHTFPVALTTTELAFNQDLRALTPHSGILPEYLLRALQYEGMAILFAVKEATHGTRRIESPMLRAWPIPLPSAQEQAEIIRRVDALMRIVDAVETRVAAATTRCDRITHSILVKAFRGELVPTEADLARRERRDYEPASVLLDRIGIMADQATSKGRGGTRRHKLKRAKGLSAASRRAL